jgi:type IV secretion system protein VirB5
MRFKRAVQRYGRTPEPETPYQRAGQLWDERIGSARVQARNWRLMAFGGLILSSGLSCGLVWQSMQSRVIPYVVEVDRLGQPLALAPADAGYHPTDPQIAWHLGRLIANIRSVSLDPVLMRQNWLAAYDFVSPRGRLFLDEYARASKPFDAIGEHTVAVQVTSVVRASTSSFQVKWIERRFDRGALAATSRWTAILPVVVQPPRSADTLRKNPLGLYVDGLDWSRELEEAPRPSPSAYPARPRPAGLSSLADPLDAPIFQPQPRRDVRSMP